MPRAAPPRRLRRRSPSPQSHSNDYAMFAEVQDKRARRQRTLTFTVVTSPGRVRSDETVCIVGNCEELGSWKPSGVIPLTYNPDTNKWSNTINIPDEEEILYRYCISMLFGDPPRFMISSWETHLRPRKIAKASTVTTANDSYGEYGGHFKVDRGWLTTESVLQLKFYKNPFTFKSRIKDGQLRVKIIPVNFQFNTDISTPTVDESLNADTNDGEPPMYVFTEVATINSANPKFQPQEQFGRVYNNGDFIIFNIKCPNLHALAYLVDFYKHSSRASPGDPPRHLGSCYVLPNVLKKTDGQIELPITCASKHRPLGSMCCEYLMVRPMTENLCEMSASYVTHWNEKWRGLEVGHRGSGSSFKSVDTTIRENTIASLKNAAASGADLIEFDVQLSKDLIPVVYHDFHVCIALKRKKQIEYSEMLEIPMQDLTLEQLQKLKVYHVVEGRTNEPRFFDEDLAEHQPFPLLSEVLQAIDPHTGFNIEIKGTTPLEDGTMELEHPLDLNLYLDKILNVVLRSDRSRKIVFSSFHPDICTMLRLKQNIYPSMFLTQGITSRYPSYRDIRCNTIPMAMNHALNTGLLGIVVHTEDLLRDSSQVRLVIDSGLIMFCWGEDNNNTDTIKYLKELGLHAVIYDKLDQYSTKEVKESIFLVEAREAQKELIKIAEDNSENASEVNGAAGAQNNYSGSCSSQDGANSQGASSCS